jgi:hypothetical protein
MPWWLKAALLSAGWFLLVPAVLIPVGAAVAAANPETDARELGAQAFYASPLLWIGGWFMIWGSAARRRGGATRRGERT